MIKLQEQIKQYADKLRLTWLKNNLETAIQSAQIDKPTYLEFTNEIMPKEVFQGA